MSDWGAGFATGMVVGLVIGIAAGRRQKPYLWYQFFLRCFIGSGYDTKLGLRPSLIDTKTCHVPKAGL